MKKSVHLKTKLINLLLLAAVTLLSALGSAQTYTTVASGNWSNPSTWVGGVVPNSAISAGKVVNVNHTVTYDVNNDLKISGILNIVGDTLKFGTSFNNNVQVNAGGLLYVNNGGFLQNIQSHNSDMTVDMGKVVFNNAKVAISKGFLAVKGARRTIKNSTLLVGEKYELDGSITSPSVDTINYSIVEVSMSASGDFRIRTNNTLRVANAYIKVNNGSDFRNEVLATISVLPGANSNYGFDLLKVTGDLKNDGNWVARIDAACISGNIQGLQLASIDFTRSQDCSSTPSIGAAPELLFRNPVLKSGVANKQGAVYRFASVMSGVDAEITLKKFSRADIVMQDIDLSSLGWDKAFQPQFGLSGLVQPNQNWYIDFQLKFYQAGTNTLKVLPKIDMTALDVDGDGNSINEYAVFQNPSNVMYSTINYLVDQPAGILGQSFICPLDSIISPLIGCFNCGGDGKTGIWNLTDCPVCEGTGLLYTLCQHAFDGVNGNRLEGPVQNFVNIDTAATQVMATYQFTDRSVIDFRYGARSGANSSNGSGIRLNSLWFRQFSLAPSIKITSLPVKLLDFTAKYTKPNVLLEWSTSQEHDFSHFILEHSTDGTNFDQTALVFGAGESNSRIDYSYTDKNMNDRGGIIYYRLKQVDVDGKFDYSRVRIVKLGEEDKSISVTTFPNPVVKDLRITLPSSWQNKRVYVDLYNANGQLINTLQIANSSQTESISVSTLRKGTYFLYARCGNETARQQIIKN